MSEDAPDMSKLSRRGFMKAGALAAGAAAGAGMSGALAGCQGVHVPSGAGLAASGNGDSASAIATDGGTAPPRSGTLRVGLIGCGGRGTGAAIQALSADQHVVLTAMGDVFADRLELSLRGITGELGEAAATKVDVPPARRFTGFDAYQRVIDSGVDVVLLTAYPQFRPLHMRAAVEAGKHVFAEKPLAVDAPGLRSVRESARLARERGLAVVSGFCWRYAEAERATFEHLYRGGIGDVLAVHSTYHTGTLGKRPRRPEWTDMEFQLRNWWHFTWLSGDHLVEQAVHSIDRMSWAMRDEAPARCVALGGRAARRGPESGNAYDHFTVIYEYAGGRRGILTCCQIDGFPSDNTDFIYGTRGVCTVNGFSGVHEVRDLAGKRAWTYDGPSRDMYQNEHDALFAAIRSGRLINDGERMCHSTMLALMGRMAAYTGKSVSWDEAWASDERLGPADSQMAFGDLPEPRVAVPGR